MLAKVFSSALIGIDAILVDVEVDLAPGLPAFATVGLPDGAVKESKDRVKAALKNSGYDFPARRITANLAPADIKKEGACREHRYLPSTTLFANKLKIITNENSC
jgi:magnesium chelatase family protein